MKWRESVWTHFVSRQEETGKVYMYVMYNTGLLNNKLNDIYKMDDPHTIAMW